MTPDNNYFSGLANISEKLLSIESNLRVCKSITNFNGLAAGTEQAIKKNIPLMESRVSELKRTLRII